MRMSFPRLALIASTVATLMAAAGAHAQSWPSKPVRVIVPFPPGGTVDTVARTFGQKMSETWGQPVVVDNRAGAGGNIGADAVAKAAPDGLTLLMSIHGIAISANLYRKLPFDPVRDLAPVSQLTSSTQALVVPTSVPATSLKELIALARAQPGKLNFASAGLGTPNHLYGEMLKSAAGIDIVHIPYKGDAPQSAALLAGEVQMSFIPVFAVLPQMKAGKLRALGVTSGKRMDRLPDVPTMIEGGIPDFEFTGWLGLLAPGGTPRDIQQKVSAEAVRILSLPDIREKLPGWGYEPVGSTPDEFAVKYKADIARYGRIIREAKVPLVD